MSEDFKNEALSETVENAVQSIAEDIVMDAIAEAVEEKVEELLAPIVEEAKPEPAAEPEPTKAEEVITMQGYGASDEVNAMGVVNNGAIGSTKTKPVAKKVAPKKAAPKPETVAVYSEKNVTWNGVGKVYRGYNIVDKAAADKWLTRSHIRLATPEEVAKEFGK